MNRIIVVVIGVILLAGVIPTFAQFPQGERFRRRVDAATQAAEAREHDRRLAAATALPVPKAAVMNVDVQMVLSTREHKSFAEAKAAQSKRVEDGDPLWLYVKFNGKLGDYVLTTRDPLDPEKLRYTLWTEIAPEGDAAAKYQYSIQFSKDELSASEIKMNLAPGIFGRNRFVPVFLLVSGAINSGVWNNELRLTNSTAVPRRLNENLATAVVTLDLSKSIGKYRQMGSEYESIILRGSTDRTKLPIPGNFYSEELKTRIAEMVTASGIQPVRIYFSGDDWHEIATFFPASVRSRKAFATFTYRRGESCFYGIAEVTEKYDLINSKYGDAEIALQKDMAVPCTEIN